MHCCIIFANEYDESGCIGLVTRQVCPHCNNIQNSLLKKFACAVAASFIFFAGVSCSQEDEQDVVIVSVGEAELTRNKLMTLLPVVSSPADSAVFADEFIRSWVFRQVLLQKAEQYLSNETEDIEAAVEEYRSSLIIETYQNKLVDQKFNSSVSDDDVEAYYKDMKQNFVLNEPIIKGVYAVLPANAPDLKGFVKLITKLGDDESAKVEEYLYSNAAQYKSFFDTWTTYSSVKKFFPADVAPDDPKTLVGKPALQSEKDGSIYLIKVTEAIAAGGQAPLDYVRGDIKNILVSKRKLEFLSSANRDLYDEAVKAGTIKFYENND